MSEIWLTSDEHYGHEKILQYCSRPFKDTREMQHELIKRHNSVVCKDDIVWHLGDVFWGDNWNQLASILKRLNGTHHLILGNHDHMSVWNYLEAGFVSVHTSIKIDDLNLVHDPAVAGVIRDKIFIHGHTHGLGKMLSNNTYCVSVELHDYYPVNLETIRSELWPTYGGSNEGKANKDSF